MAKIDYVDAVIDKVRDDVGRISADDRDTAITHAVQRYSLDRPRVLVEDIAAPGGHYLPLPVAWSAEFSRLLCVEFPIGQVPTALITDYTLYQSPSDTQFQFVRSFSATDSVRASFTVPHTVSEVTDTIPLRDRDAVACWAAALLCDDLGAFYSGSTDSTINADAVNHGEKSNQFRAQARNLRKRYHDHLGIDEKRNTAAGVVVDMDRNDSQGNDRLYHGRRYR